MSSRRNAKSQLGDWPESLGDDSLWYRDAIFYELRVGAFQDSDGDGIGDFRGLIERLDYLQDLGVTVLWLLPFYPSPLRDDGYDISDYTNVDPQLGSLDDFRAVLREAHQRGLRVITELVLNHTSDQHPWFQRARRAPAGSRWRNYYVWSDDPEKYAEARVIFQDFEPSNWSWDPVAKSYYWHRFYAHQPDLNFESADVRRAVVRFLDFWLGMGVDGLRLDAIPYLYEQEGTNCENLPQTHGFLKDLRQHIDATHRDRMLLAEANQWPEDAVAYFGQGDECHMAFHFPVMPRLFMALQMEDRYPIIDILIQTPPIPETCQWALFLRNHDELTLEMVTDEERDYMYRVYAADARARLNLGIRRRLAPLLGNDRRRIELMNALLYSLPGTPVLYYGDEIGMGDNIYLGDRNGVRTPMQWSSDRNAGFSRANPQQLYLPIIVDPEYHFESINVEAQQKNPHSLLSWTKRLISLRKRHRAFGRGVFELLHPSNRKVLAFVRAHDSERILVVANLSRFVEYVELDLSQYVDVVPFEIFSGKPFPRIGSLPYLLTLGPHDFYWFRLEAEREGERAAVEVGQPVLPKLSIRGSWRGVLQPDNREIFEQVLPELLRARRWFGGKGSPIASASIVDVLPLGSGDAAAQLAMVEVGRDGAIPELYCMPIAFLAGDRADALRRDRPNAIFAELEVVGKGASAQGVLCDALEQAEVCADLLDAIRRRRKIRGESGTLLATPSRALVRFRDVEERWLAPSLVRTEQSNSTILYGEKLILKVFRRLAEGINPELEIGRFLTERARFSHTPEVAGAFEYRRGRQKSQTLAVLTSYVENEGEAWTYTLDQVGQYFERALARQHEIGVIPVLERDAVDLVAEETPALIVELVGGYLESARLLGARTAELHLALASDPSDPSFAPEPFTSLYQRARYQSMRNTTAHSFDLLKARQGALVGDVAAEAGRLLGMKERVLEEFRAILGARFGGTRIRCHGDYHLGQVLHTGNDFVIIDFEGEPARSPGERKLKRSPLTDVAGMLRSFDYVAHHALLSHDAMIRSQDETNLERWANLWVKWAGAAFLRGYFPAIADRQLIPSDPRQLRSLLRVLLLDKAIYELGYELDNRPAWASLPIRGILDLLESPRGGRS